MSCNDWIEVVPTTTASYGGTSEVRYRLLMAALESYAESVPPAQLGVADAALAKPASRRAKPKRSRA
jgi:hypothetical protein